jgi:peptide/nickel transport system substrate-binding protein
VFQDRRVRDALTYAFDFEWLNQTLFHGSYARIPSYYGNSSLAFRGAAEGAERALLAPFADELPAGVLDAGYAPPESDGKGANRRNLRQASRLLAEAGWTVQDGVLKNAAGEAMSFEILLGSNTDERIAAPFAEALAKLGVEARLRLVDGPQYQAQRAAYDYDMVVNKWWLSLSPGNEQRHYWGSQGVEQEGTRNYMGVASPAVDAMIDKLLVAEERAEFEAAVRALDRVLVAGRYVIPFWYEPVDRFVWGKELQGPERQSLYGWRPETWWSVE